MLPVAAVSPGALEWVLRVGACLCFVGHGAFGIITKAAWVPYFGVAGIGPDLAYALMPVVGAVDVMLGLLVLVTLRPALLLWMTAWAVWTALLRPLSGEPAWETLERAGNYGVPFALLLMVTTRAAWGAWRSWFASGRTQPLSPELLIRLRRVLVATVALLLLGHGALGVIHKAGLIANYAPIAGTAAGALTPAIGWFEVALAVLVVLLPSVPVALFIVAWKLATESLFLAAGAPIWEVVERGGSYAAPLALAIVLALQEGRTRLTAMSPRSTV